MPELYKQSRALLPRATRCSVGWRRRDPGQMRLPMPRAAALAVAGLLMFWGKPRMAISVALSHVCYLRPSEMIRLKGSDVTPPSAAAGLMYASWGLLLHDATSGRPGKTGMWDESVVLDLDLWIVAPLAALAKIAGSRCMWDFTVAELNALFQRAVVALRLQSLRPHLYALRHGGASEDLTRNRRSLEQVMRRGRCVATSSVRRYAKETRLLKEMAKVDPLIFEFGLMVEQHFAALILLGAWSSEFLALVPQGLRQSVQLGPGQ